MNNKERFFALCESVEREGMDELLDWLKTTDFFVCPASTNKHGAKPEGLLEHSLNVYSNAVTLLQAYPKLKVPHDTLVISTLFHDLCKVNFYTTEKRNRKNAAGQWESYDAYKINEKFCFGGHGSKSVFLIQNFMKLTLEEAVAINCHMSSWDDNKYVSNAYEQFPFAWIVHVADEAATFIDEGKDS